MPYTVSWHTEPTILHTEIFGEVTIEELEALCREILTIFAQHTTPIYLLTNMADITSQPSDLRRLRQAFYPLMGHALWAASVVYGADKFTTIVLTTLRNLTATPLYVVKTKEHGLEFIQRHQLR